MLICNVDYVGLGFRFKTELHKKEDLGNTEM